MRAAMDQEQEQDELAHELAGLNNPQPVREFTLTTTTLLVFFFGLVMVCGLFFGLGYSLGRGELSLASPLQPKTLAAPATQTAHEKPAATTQNTSSKPPQPTPGDSSSAQAQSPTAASDTPQPIPATLTPQSASPPESAPPTASTPPSPAPIMVQIAAVSDQNDADVLLSALRKRGYTVSVHREPGDSLMHVQVGPFANPADAKAMRQKLLSDGYNAILR